MEKNWKVTGPVCSVTWDKKVKHYASLSDAVRDNEHYIKNSYKYGFLKREANDPLFQFLYIGDDILFKDDCGLVIPVWKVKEACANLPYIPYYNRYRFYRRHKNIEQHLPGGKHYRKESVHGIRCYRGGYSYWQYPKTRNEIVQNHCFEHSEERKEYKIKIRRRRLNLPTVYDDLARYDWKNKNWKRYRKHQWKEK